MDIQQKNKVFDLFKKTNTFKYFYSTLLRFDYDLNCFVATEKWRNKEAELLTAAWWMFEEAYASLWLLETEQAAQANAVPEWTVVADELPHEEADILFYLDIDDVILDGYYSNSTFIAAYSTHLRSHVSHWSITHKNQKHRSQAMTEIKTVWFDREKARNVLAMMRRGEAVRVNGRTVIFSESGYFDVKQDFNSGHFSQSLKATLDYLFGEHELPKAIEQSLKEVS